MHISNTGLILLFAVIAFLAILVVLCLVLCIACMKKINEMKKSNVNSLTEEKIMKYIDNVKGEIPSGEGGYNPNVFCKSSVVKFNAYDDITGEYSFCLALLNGFNNGIILTSLYGHNSCNTYIRKIKSGVCKTFLLAEEKEALNNALSGKE